MVKTNSILLKLIKFVNTVVEEYFLFESIILGNLTIWEYGVQMIPMLVWVILMLCIVD